MTTQNKLDQILGTSAAELRERVKKSRENAEKNKFKFNFTPRTIYDELSKYVIGQEEAMQRVCSAVSYHYKGLSKNGTNNKCNVLLIGPTGCGKTYLIQKVSEILRVPLIISDATRFSATGYVGDKVDSLVSDLLIKAKYDVNAASRGIIYLDEIDKIASKEMMGRDVSGRDVQNGLLKIIEGGEIRVNNGGSEVLINTKEILFIGGGAFSDLYKILKTTSKVEAGREKEFDNGEALENAKPPQLLKALEKYGIIPELLGRIPVIAKFRQLTKDDMVRILKESKDSPMNFYLKDLEAYGIKAKFSEDSYITIADLASTRGMGARGLKSVIEESLMPFKFYLPGMGITDLEISSKYILEPEETLLSLFEAQQNKPGGKNGKTKY